LRAILILILFASLMLITPVHAQEVSCSPDDVIASFAATTDIAAWAQQYKACPNQTQRAVRSLATGYQLLNSEYLPFAAAEDPYAFSLAWKWYQGSSGSLVHNVDPTTNTLTLIADNMTDQRDAINTAPILAYPVVGDVTAQVKLSFSPLDEQNGAGMGIRSSQDPTSWIRIARIGENIEVTATDTGTSTVVESIPFDGEQVAYLKVERVGMVFTLSYSLNGTDWIAVVSDYSQSLPEDTEVFLTTFWPVERAAASAAFSEMKVE
jgi:hypothetical protein